MSEFPIPRDGYLAFDAFTLKQHIKNALNQGGKFTDQNYEGSYMASVIDIIAYTFHVLMFYMNKTSTETMFTEVQLYENINRIVKMLDYKPIGYSTSILSFIMTAQTNLAADTYVIPRYSYVSAKGIPYAFNDDITITKTTTGAETLNIGDTVLLYQGVWREYTLYTARGEQNELIYLVPGTNVKVDHNNIDIYVKSADTGKWSKWSRSMSLYLENGFSKMYEIRFNEKQQYEIKFGNNINGLKLNEGDQVAIYYLETRGADGQVGVGALGNQSPKLFRTTQLQNILVDVNANNSVAYISDSNAAQLTLNNSSISTYAADAETVESIRQNAPSTFRSQYRLVTQGDYETFISINFAKLIHSVKVINNWSYVSAYVKYYYDLGLTDPNNISRVLYNQLNFADACNFNNVYVFAVPNVLPTTTEDLVYLSSSNKSLIIASVGSVKTMTSEVIILDPVYIAHRICAPKTTGSLTLDDADNSVLTIVKDPNSRRDNNTIIKDVSSVINDYFARGNSNLGQTVDVNQMTSDILSIQGIKSIYTTNTVTGDRFDGLSLLQWDPVYPTVSPSIIFNNKTLETFMFPVWYDKDLTSKITITTATKIYENVEY